MILLCGVLSMKDVFAVGLLFPRMQSWSSVERMEDVWTSTQSDPPLHVPISTDEILHRGCLRCFEKRVHACFGIIWGGGQVGSTLWSLGIGAVDDDAPMDILPEIEEEVPKLVSTFRNPHFRWFGRDVMDWITMIHRGRPWALFSGVVLRARRGETTWLFFSLRLSFGMIGSSGWYCYQN